MSHSTGFLYLHPHRWIS